MKNPIIFISLLLSINTYAQTISQLDSVSYTICDYLKTLEKIDNDTLKYDVLINTKFIPFLQTVDEQKIDEVGDQLYIRLQKNCVEFVELLDRMDPPEKEIESTTQIVESKITKKELKEFKKRKAFHYFEASGNQVKVSMRKNKWNELFIDSTSSNLTYEWIGPFEFELTFIESTNTIRSNVREKGDQFICKLLEKREDHYLMSIKIKGKETYQLFELYFE